MKSSRIQAPKLMAFGFRLSAFVGDGGRTFTKDQCQTDGIHGRTPYFDLGSSLEDTRFGVSLNTGNPKQKPHLKKPKNTSPKIDTNQPCFLQFWLKTIARVGAFARFALTYTMCSAHGAHGAKRIAPRRRSRGLRRGKVAQRCCGDGAVDQSCLRLSETLCPPQFGQVVDKPRWSASILGKVVDNPRG